MSTTEIRDALHEVGGAVPVAPVDEVAFQRAVRRERRGHHARRVAGAATAAAAVVVAGVLVATFRPSDEAREVTPAVPNAGGPGLSEVLPLVVDGELVALDPAGTVHDLGLRSEELIGYTTERVVALDDTSHVVVRTIQRDEAGGATFADAPSPVPDAVSSVQMSADGRWLAWLTVDDRLHVYDLKAEQVSWETAVGPNSYVADVADRGVLVSEDGDLAVISEDGARIPVPTLGDGYGWASGLAMDRVAVVDRDDRTRVYDVSTGAAVREAVLDGSGSLAPYAEGVAVLMTARDDVTSVAVWDGAATREVTGLTGYASEVSWVQDGSDRGAVLVTTGSADGVQLFSCSPVTLDCRVLPVVGEDAISAP